MRALLCGVAVTLLSAGSAAFAEDEVVVRWTRLEAVTGAGAGVPLAIGPLAGTSDEYIDPSGRWRTVGRGWAMVNVKNGALSFHMEGLSEAFVGIGSPLGGPIPTPTVKGTVVCYSTRPGYVVFVDTPTITIDERNTGSFEGFVDLPWECADAPREIAFLIRHDTPDRPAIDGDYLVYGAGRVIYP
jgi:hypothetical protein